MAYTNSSQQMVICKFCFLSIKRNVIKKNGANGPYFVKKDMKET